ncbi:MAG: OB-fold domain-containing protein [Mycobacteriaceae bacterium]|nr:OB-fold domain-containing protein [Mycobacteriaceae bacterium]
MTAGEGNANQLDVRPAPIPDAVSEFYWRNAKDGKLTIQGFEGTDILQHPPSPVPEVPGGAEGKPIAVEVSGRGTLFAFTILHQPFHPGFVDAMPLIIGLTELDDAPGVRILTNIVDAEPRELRCGLPMEVVFEQRGNFALPQFRPVREPRAGA